MMDVLERSSRYMLLLRLLRRYRGGAMSLPAARCMKRLIAFNNLRRECRRLLALAKAAEQKKERSCHTKPIFQVRELYGAWHTLVPQLRKDPEEHFNFFRMSVKCFDTLRRKLAPLIRKGSFRKPISVGQRLAVTLRYLASGASQIDLSYLFRIADSTVSTIVNETAAAIWFVLRREAFEPLSQDLWRKKAAEFEQMWNFPMCVGAIDGKHCVVQKFPGRGTDNYNFKGSHSVVLLGVSDAKYKFILVDVGAKGIEADGGVFERSEFGQLYSANALALPPPAYNQLLGENLPYVFVGDDAFTLDKNLMKPFSGKELSAEEQIFNYRLSRARRVVENAFGILSARYRILRRAMIVNETLSQSIILACCALHNWHLMNEESIPPKQRVYLPDGYADVFQSNGYFKAGRWRNEVPHEERTIQNRLAQEEVEGEPFCNQAGAEVREKFMELFLGVTVPWQWDVVFNQKK